MMVDFHATIKLVTGEEIFALVSVDNSEDEPVVIMQNPVIMKVLSHSVNRESNSRCSHIRVRVNVWNHTPTTITSRST